MYHPANDHFWPKIAPGKEFTSVAFGHIAALDFLVPSVGFGSSLCKNSVMAIYQAIMGLVRAVVRLSGVLSSIPFYWMPTFLYGIRTWEGLFWYFRRPIFDG